MTPELILLGVFAAWVLGVVFITRDKSGRPGLLRRRWRLFNHFCYLVIVGDSMDFSMDDKQLYEPFASRSPHEPPAALRMQQAGWPGPKIMETLGYRGTQLMKVLEGGLDEQNLAARRGCPMHDARI